MEALAWAIMQQEGFKPGTRSWNNSNPGDLKDSIIKDGETDGFATFASFERGWMALIIDLTLKCTIIGPENLGPQKTLQDLINVYAPAADGNDPVEYCKSVAAMLGIETTTELAYFTIMQ